MAQAVVGRIALVAALSCLTACNGTWKLAPPPDTGAPVRTTRSSGQHRHVHVPGEVRGQRLEPVFARSIALTLYRDRQWLVDSATIDSLVPALASLAPTHVFGLFRFSAGEQPTARHRAVWSAVRSALTAARADVRLDVALDATLYTSGPDVVAHLRMLADLLEPDLWYFAFWDIAEREAFDVVASAIAQAHANGQAIGGLVSGNEIASDSDFGVLAANVDGDKLRRQLRGLLRYHDLPYLVVRTTGSAGGALTAGSRCYFSWRMTTPGAASGFTAEALRDSLAAAPTCRSAQRQSINGRGELRER